MGGVAIRMVIRREALAARREALGYTQEMVTQRLGVELSTVGRWERGRLTPQPWRRPDLAEVLQVSLGDLDALLNPPGPQAQAQAVVGESLASRRGVMVDAAVLAGAVVADRVVGRQDWHLPVGEVEVSDRVPALSGAAAVVAGVHRAYQAARYGEVARLLPAVSGVVNVLVAEAPAPQRREALGLQTSVCIATAKLATKSGDAAGGWAAAERARVAAVAADDAFGRAGAAYQMACALLCAGRGEQAEHLAVRCAGDVRGADPLALTWRGALTLISAIIAARRGDPAEAGRRLDHAEDLARRLGADANIGWSAFGPTNVLIHRVSAAIALGDPHAALATAQRIDLTAMPAGLCGRQAQVHLDSARAHAQLGEDPEAVIHLLETERVAPHLLRTHPPARTLIQDLLVRQRRRAVPGLRALGLRVGVAA